ncbi:MAG: aminotransferase class IV [Cyclonatronaceae bacterium]
MRVYVNGRYLPRDEAAIPVNDRGFLFGDGIYEVIRVVNGRMFRLEAHLKRMDRGLEGLGIPFSTGQRDGLSEIMQKLIIENRLQEGEGTIYLQITRGVALPRTHAFPPESTPPTVVIMASPFIPDKEILEKGGHAITMPDIRWSRCDLKTVNLLPNVMAAQEEKKRGAGGVLMVRDGFITEGYKNNVFAVYGGTLWTYPDSPYILAGITREEVFEIAEEEGIPVRLSPIEQKQILKADEVMLTGTITDIQPVVSIDGHRIGTGRPGTVAKKLQHGLRRRMDSE